MQRGKGDSPTIWEVERDRFGVMFSGPLEVRECIEVVPRAEYDFDCAVPIVELREDLERSEAACDSLRLELEGARHCHRRDNEYLLGRAKRAEAGAPPWT